MTDGAITRLPEGQRVLTYRTSGSASPRPSSAAGPRPSSTEPPSEPRAFTTLFDSRNVAHKRALSTQEQIQYFFTGIAGLADRTPLTKREQPAVNEATRKARRQVLYLIEAREAAVELLRELMPTPLDEKHGDRLAHQIFTSRDTAPLFELRERFSALFSMVRALSVAIVDATDCWRRELRRSSSHYRSFPDLELPFIWGEPSRSYAAHMCTDLNFLPAPVLADPLLAEWLGRQLEWVLAHDPNVDGPSSHTSRAELRAFVVLVREACPSTSHLEELVRSLAPAAAKAADATLSAHRHAMLIASPGALTSPETLHHVLRGYADALDRMMADGSVPSASETMVGNQLGSFQALQMRRAADELDALEDEARRLEAAKEVAALDLARAQGVERALMAMVAIQNQHKAAAVVPSEAAAMATSKSASAAVCLAELELAAAEAAWRKQAVDRAKPLLTEWLRLEGASRMHAELEAQERERLRSLLLAQRAQAYRRVGETPVAERVAYKRAVRELAAAAAAQLELTSVSSMVVQTRTYTEGCVTLDVLDRAEPAVVAALTNDPEAQKEMLGSLAAFLGEFDEERLYMASAERVSVLLRTSKREGLEPASRLVIGVRLEKLGQMPAAQLISEVISAHDRRELGRQIGVPHESVHTLSTTPPVEHLTEAPTLWQLRAAADARTAAAEVDLKRLEADKMACDLAWNLGLPASKGDQYCFYCAGLTPPVRATHPLSACPKRKRAGDREYTSFAMERVLSAAETRRLRHEHVVAAVAAEAFSASTSARKQAKQDLVAIAAAVKLLVDPAEDTALAPPPPPPPPASERRRMWEMHMRRRQGDAQTVMGMLGRAARHSPNPWAELKAVTLFTPHSRVLQRPVDAAWLHAVGRSVGLDVGIGGKDHVLLPFVIELARAPLPPGWSAVSGDGAYCHAHVSTGSMVDGHPLSAAMGSHIAGIISRARRTQRLKPMGSWVQMASEDGRSPIFVDLHSGTVSYEFPTVRGISACVLPQRQLEPSAERLAAAAEACWRDVPDADVVAMAKSALWAEGLSFLTGVARRLRRAVQGRPTVANVMAAPSEAVDGA
ncbi:hypothetical protein Ctob_005592 [Chrysochromulina tobinii]|uniref:Uncharacterized protein n=1 Tax=Chrysochromulina tobinii TaxID=1460289 RepID=A0A0M0JUR8_9EUKA|nr:hypothetical protein Ctob_005592 [Chrysochromulina tobinii]|eukprot:KOO30067.1 hypothetical protein Ctob_005592 [Chrysochromulina sp. CCMP291]